MIKHYRIHEVSEYIDWIYFFHAWGFSPRKTQTPEAMQLLQEAKEMLELLDKNFQTHAVLRLMDANSEENDIWKF